MSLDLGALLATAGIDTTPFDTAYPALLRKMSTLGVEAQKVTAGTASLDEAVAALGRTSTMAAGGLDQVTAAGTKTAASEEKATAAARAHATAIDQITAVTDPYIGSSARVQAAQLRQIAAQERVDALMESGTATTRQLAAANATLIASTRAVASAQEAEAVSSSKATGAFAGTVKMAAGLGIAFGAFEVIKQALDVGKQASSLQKSMLLIETQAGASDAAVKVMTADVLRLAAPLGTKPDELATSLYHVVSAGEGILTLAQEIDVMTVAAKGAKIGNADLEETTNALTATVVSGIKGTKDYAQAMGALNTIVGAGDMKLSDLNQALGSGLLANMKNFGLDIFDVGAALDVFGDNNVRGAEAATQLRMSVQAMAAPAKLGHETLKELGLSATDLGNAIQKGGLNAGLEMLVAHLVAAGKITSITDLSDEIAGMKGNIDLSAVAGSSLGQLLTEAFGKKAGPGLAVLVSQLDRFEVKLQQNKDGANNFESAWQKTQQTVSFAWDRITAGVEAGGIAFANKLMPQVQTAAHWIGTDLPHDLSVLQSTLLPVEKEVGGAFTIAWHVLADVLGVVGPVLGDVGHFLAENKGLVTDVVTPVLAMWAAYKGYQIATLAIDAVRFRMASMGAAGRNMLASIRTTGVGVGATFAGNATEAQLSAMIQTQAFAEIEAAALQSAAVQDRAAAMKAVAFADETAASAVASDEEIAAADAAAAAALAQARASVLAARMTSEAAEAAAAAVTTAGEEAAVGWGAMLGPIGLVAVGATALFSLFDSGSSTTNEVTEAVSGLTSALNADSDALGTHVRAQIEDNLVKDAAYQAALKLGISQKTLTDAAMGNQAALDSVNAALDAGQHSSDANKERVLIVASALGTQSKALKQAVSDQKDKAAADGKSTTAIGANTDALSKNAAAVADQAAATAKANAATAYQATLLGTTSVAYQAAVTAAAQSTAQTEAQTLAFQLEGNAAGLVNDALATMAGQNLSVAQAQTALDSATMAVIASLKKNGSTTADNTAKGVANRQAIEGAASALRAKLTADAQATGSTEKATATYRTNASALLDQIGKLDGTKSAAYRYAQQLLAIPPVTKTKVELEADAAKAALKAYEIAISKIPHYYQTQMQLNVTENVNKVAAGSAGHHALGGLITGPGSTTSDSIPEMLSNREYVENAAAYAKFGPILEAINSGTVSSMADLARVIPNGSKGMAAFPLAPAITVSSSAATAAGPVSVRVFIGNEEIRDIARVEVTRGIGDAAREFAHVGGWDG